MYASKGGYFHGTAGYCNMTCRSMKSGQKFQRARNGITRNLSREENGSESSAESVSESKRKDARRDESESPGFNSGGKEGLKG